MMFLSEQEALRLILLDDGRDYAKYAKGLAAIALAGASAGLLYAYYKAPDKIYFVADFIPDKNIKKARQEVSKITGRGPQGLKMITAVLKKYGVVYTKTYRIVVPSTFISNYIRLMALIRSYIPHIKGDGFFTTKECREVLKLTTKPEIRNSFCRVVSTTNRYKHPHYDYDETIQKEECTEAFRWLEGALHASISNGVGLYVGAATALL